MKLNNLLVALMFLASSGMAAAADHLMVNDAWVREAPPGAMALAGYMQLQNHGDKERVLVSAESPAFEGVMLHRTVMEGEMSRMVHQESITIPANGMVSFEPNSYHLMMMKPKQALKAGDRVSVTLHFKNGENMQISHEVRAAMGSMDHSGHGMGGAHGHNH